MATFDREIIELVLANCQAGQGDVAQALGRALDATVEVTVGHGGPFDIDQVPPECTGAGLILVLQVGFAAALVVLPESSGLVPNWCIEANTETNDRLATLASELGRRLFPEPFSATEWTGGYVRDLAAALRRAGLAPEAGCVALQAKCAEKAGVLSLLWPASQADAALNETSAGSNSPAADSPRGSEKMKPAATEPASGLPRRQIVYQELEDGIAQLPCYSRSLLKIKVPVMVTLAEAKQPVENVLNIGPGSIIHFNKPCEDTLTLEVAGQKVAVGEAVKVGDKFGLWITSMILPEERFWIISKRAGSERAK